MAKRWGVLTALLLVGGARAEGGAVDPLASSSAEPVRVLDAVPPAHACAAHVQLCVFAGARSTVAAAPQPGAPARFARATSLASAAPERALAKGSERSAAASAEPWSVDVVAHLKRPAFAGNTLFLFFDADDPQAMSAHQYTALFQARVAAGRSLAARFTLDPSDGFRPGHTYRVRIVQLIGGREVLLAEGDVGLL
jgi:hypothetical protein